MMGPAASILRGRRYIKASLGGPTPAEYEAVVAERDGLKRQLQEAQAKIAELEVKVRRATAGIHAVEHAMLHQGGAGDAGVTR